MRIKTFAGAALLFSVLCSTAYAQGARIDASKWLQSAQASDWRATSMRDMTVADDKGETIGKTVDMMIDHDGKISAVIFDISLLTGQPNSRVALPFDQIQISETGAVSAEDVARGGDAPTTTGAPQLSGPQGSSAAPAATAAQKSPGKIVINLTKEEIRKAPRFEVGK